MLEISFGRNRSDTSWKVEYLEWGEFVDRLRKVRRTNETMAEYQKMTKKQQGKVKDGPAFVGGLIRGGRRKKANVENRWLITLDADHANDEFMVDVDLVLGGMAYVIYSTHSHRPEKPKYRLIIPAARAMTPDEYAAASRKLAEQIGMAYFDKTTFQVHRLMYMPSCSKDAEPVFEAAEGEPLDVDDVLAEYVDWKDPLEWPIHPEEDRRDSPQASDSKMEDPQTKPGVIGAFCRAYTISEAIETFLSDVYEPTTSEERYTYAESTSYGGLVIYDNDTFAYSYHESDPISRREVNAFDLVRIHKFGDLDENIKPHTPVNKHPSYQAMCEFASKIPTVKKIMHDDRMEELKEDFAEDIDGEIDWVEKLEVHPKTGLPYANSRNAEIILTHGPLKGTLAYDDFKNREVILKDLPWRKRRRPNDSYEPWLGSDDAELRHYFGKVYDFKSANIIRDAFTHVARKNSFHPIHDYIESFEWDGKERLESLFIDYLGAHDNPYVRTVTRKMFVAAVTRIYEPGTKFDEMLVLVGPQGCGKSTILSKMGRQWFCDSLKTFDSKEAGEYLQSSWIFEFGELSAMKKAEVEEIKAFTSKTTDMYRVAYDRVVSEFPRKCVFFGTTNNYDFLKDQTGNRRFWPVTVEPEKATKDVFTDLVDEVVGQLWAEAKHYYDQGETLTLPRDVAKMAEDIQDAHLEDDPRKGMIMEFLETPIQEDFMDEPVKRTRVSAAEIWVECFGRDKGLMRPWDAKEIYSILRTIPGWRDAGRKRVKGYNIQRVFERTQ